MAVSFDFSITNIDGSVAAFRMKSDWKLDLYFDKPGQFSGTLVGRHSVGADATLEVNYKGTIKFRGIITQPEENKDGTTKIVAEELQSCLEDRYYQIYEYPAGTTVNAILSDAVPPTGSYWGMLALANCLIPQGSFVVHSPYSYIYKIDYVEGNAGPNSIFGDVTTLYQDLTPLTEVSSIINMVPGTFHQDDTDLYVWCTDSKDPKYHLMVLPSWGKDSGLRLGTISLGASSFTGPIRLTKAKCSEDLNRIISGLGLEYYWEHRKDGHTYLMASETIGRGSEDEPVAHFYDNSG